MKKLILITALAFYVFPVVHAQIGINTNTPDSSSAMDIRSPAGGNDNRGVLFPRMTKTQRDSIANPATSLFVFDTDDGLFYYYNGSKWLGLIPKEPGGGTSPTVNGNIVVDNGSISASQMSTSTLAVTGFSNNALVPSGAILMWSGAVSAIPDGWKLCDGTVYMPDGTEATYHPLLGYPMSVIYSPNLKGRFVVGYDPSNMAYDYVGSFGGVAEVTLTGSQSGTSSHSHNHTITINNSGNHQHAAGYVDNVGGSGSFPRVSQSSQTASSTAGTLTANDGLHTHTTSGGISNSVPQNATAPHENRPPYYVIAYIIKL